MRIILNGVPLDQRQSVDDALRAAVHKFTAEMPDIGHDNPTQKEITGTVDLNGAIISVPKHEFICELGDALGKVLPRAEAYELKSLGTMDSWRRTNPSPSRSVAA